MRVRIALAAGTTAILFCVETGTALASLYLIFDRTSARVGEVIHAHTGGQGAFTAPTLPLPLFLVPARHADRVTARTDPALIELGLLVVDGRGNGRTTFEMPDVPAGRTS
jgi:hypothetical protein